VLLARGARRAIPLGRFRADLRNQGRARFRVPRLAPGVYRILVRVNGDLYPSAGVAACGRRADETLVILPVGRRSPQGTVASAGLAAAVLADVALRRRRRRGAGEPCVVPGDLQRNFTRFDP